MEIRAAKRYNKLHLGYYIDMPTAVIGGYDRAITLVNGASDTRYSGASFVNDDWFKFIAGLSTHRSVYITKDPNGVNRCLTANSRLDDDIIRRYGFRLLLPDLYEDYKDLGETGITLLNYALPDICKEIFETKRESYNRIFDVITEEYEPLYNLDVTYEEQHRGTDTEGIDTTQDTTREKDGTDSTTRSGSETLTYSGSENTKDNQGSGNTTNNYTYAFNSTDPVPAEKSELIFSKDETKSFTNRQDSRTYNNVKDQTDYGSEETEGTTIATDRSFTHGETITTRRYGNQGVTRADELVRAEIELRKATDFIRLVADDIAPQISIQ